MKVSEIASRLTGFSGLGFGASWNPPEPETTAARRMLAYLEDRRVLFAPYHLEIEDQCIQSVLDMRRELTQEIGKQGDGSKLAGHLRAIRAACHRFLRESSPDGHPLHVPSWHGRFDAAFFLALGELRATIGLHVAAIAVTYGLEVHGDLADALPDLDVDDDLP